MNTEILYTVLADAAGLGAKSSQHSAGATESPVTGNRTMDALLRPRATAVSTKHSAPFSLRVISLLLFLAITFITDYYTYHHIFTLDEKERTHDEGLHAVQRGLLAERTTVDEHERILNDTTISLDYIFDHLEQLELQSNADRQANDRISNRLAYLEKEFGSGTTSASAIANEAQPQELRGEAYRFDPTIPLVDRAVVHRTRGRADYWLIPRNADLALTRVIPYASTPFGVAVYCLDDDQAYVLAPNGSWKSF